MTSTQTASDLKAARDAWMAINATDASDADKLKAKSEYAQCAVRAAEEALGEKVLRAGSRLAIR